MAENQSEERGSGRTSRQILALPEGGIFVCNTEQRRYAVDLARHLGRKDVLIVTPSWILEQRFMGIRAPAVVCDHACPDTMSTATCMRFFAYLAELQRVIARITGKPHTKPDLSGLHNKLAGDIVASIVRPVMDAGGDFADVLVLFESVTVGVMLAGIKLGGDNITLDTVMAGAKERLATIRLEDLDTQGRG